MSESTSLFRRRPAPATLVGAALVILGFILAELDWRFLTLCAVGTFGPGILRELGWVKDKDEFQMRATHRAGYHAYLATGLTAFTLVGILRAAEGTIEQASELVTVLLAVLWFTWFLSSLYSFWGPRKTVARILTIFGAVWLVFNIIGNFEDGGMALLMQSLLASPFFLLAWASRHWPRVAGVVLLVAGGFFFYLFRLYEIFGSDPLAKGRFMVMVLFLGPLFASGVMLLTGKSTEE
jgi:hypothetical protein